MKICLHSASDQSVGRNYRKESHRLFFLGLGWQSFALGYFFSLFSDTPTPEREKVLIERKLSGVGLRCQIGVIWFSLTPRVVPVSEIAIFPTPLILNELGSIGVGWCQIILLQSDTA